MKRMKAKAVILATLALCVGASAQTVRTIYIDPISNNGPASWNNLSFGVSNNTAVLKDALASSTGIRATVTRNMNAGANANATTTPSGDAAEFAPAAGNSAYGHTTTWSGTPPIPYSEVVFSNLYPNVAYTFTFYASRIVNNSNDVRDARYTVSGASSLSAVLNACDNTSRVVTVTNVYPRADGTLTLGMQKGPNNNNATGFYYLTAMKIVYADPAATVLYVDAAGSAAAGWNLLRINDSSDVTLLATNGASSGIRALVTTPLTGVNTLAAAAPTGDAAEFLPAGTDTGYSAVPAIGVIKLFNLNPTVGYTFTFYASRVGSATNETRQTFYSATGSNAGSNNLETANNTQSVAVVAGILPAADGTISLRVSRGLTNSTGFIYLTAFKITYTDNGVTYAAADPAGKRLLFFGNEYTSAENMPELVAGLAVLGGYPRPLSVAELGAGRLLADQLARVNGYPGFNVDHPLLPGTNTWDHVIIQGHGDESSSLGNAVAFRTNALALYQAVKNHASGKGAGSKAVLFQTWARGSGATVYPATFASPSAMQAEISGNYEAASNDIATAEGAGSALLAPAGGAFAQGGFDAARLYAANLSDPANAGPELAALALYKTLYGAPSVTGFSYDEAFSAGLTTMVEADWTRVTHWADGLVPPSPQAPSASDARVYLLDACANAAGTPVYAGWNYKSFHTTGVVENLVLSNGYPTAVSCEVIQRMTSTTTTSAANPTGDAAVFARALVNNAFGNIGPWGSNTYSNEFCVARFSGLSTLNAYTFTFYASRTGTTGRETLYIVEGSNSGSAALEPGNNSTQVAVVQKIRPKSNGTIDLKITAGPNNTSLEKFYHINALMIESARGGMVMTVR